jgi:hypothetical protein
VPGPAPPVVNGLQIDQSLDFQRRFQRIQTVAWWLLALLPVAAVLGLFGGGVFSTVTAGGGGATVSYDRFGRLSASTQLEVTLRRTSGPAVVSISRGFLDGYDLSEVRPRPERVTTGAGRLDFAFASTAGGRVAFTLQTQRLGSNSGTVAVTGSRPVRVRQLVYP